MKYLITCIFRHTRSLKINIVIEFYVFRLTSLLIIYGIKFKKISVTKQSQEYIKI